MALEDGVSERRVRKTSAEAIELMDVKELQDRPITILKLWSEVAIAGMLALKPRFLLLDEPTAGVIRTRSNGDDYEKTSLQWDEHYCDKP